VEKNQPTANRLRISTVMESKAYNTNMDQTNSVHDSYWKAGI